MRDEWEESQQSDGGGAVHPSLALWRQSGIRDEFPGRRVGLDMPRKGAGTLDSG